MDTKLLTPKEASEKLNIAKNTLHKYRRDPRSGLINNVHYEIINRKTVRYRSPLVEHWFQYRNSPVHIRLIDQFLKEHDPLQIG